MTDNVALGGRYGVLRVQPQETPPRYYHRNGETEPPTVNGWYWFDGTIRDEDIYRGVVETCRFEVRGDVWFRYGIVGREWDFPEEQMQGQWWGPVVPPWSEGNG